MDFSGGFLVGYRPGITTIGKEKVFSTREPQLPESLRILVHPQWPSKPTTFSNMCFFCLYLCTIETPEANCEVVVWVTI